MANPYLFSRGIENAERKLRNRLPLFAPFGAMPAMTFTEQRVALLSSMLDRWQTVAVQIEIMHTFLCLRLIHSSNKEVARTFAV